MKINGSIIADVSIIQDFQYRLMQKKCTKVMKDFLEEHEHEICFLGYQWSPVIRTLPLVPSPRAAFLAPTDRPSDSPVCVYWKDSENQCFIFHPQQTILFILLLIASTLQNWFQSIKTYLLKIIKLKKMIWFTIKINKWHW